MVLAQVDWGSVPDWFAGTGTLLALIFAFFAVRAAHRTNIQQGLELQAMQDDRRRSQANKVAAWMIYGDEDGTRYLCVKNGSDLPVFGVLLFTGVADLSHSDDPAGATPEIIWHHQRIRAIPPGDTRLDLQDVDAMPVDDPSTADGFLIALVFLDCEGTTWLRNAYGQLYALNVRELYFTVPQQWIRERDEPVLVQLGKFLRSEPDANDPA